MKVKILLSIVTIGIALTVTAQKPSITLSFTANNGGQNLPLTSILIENITRGGDTSIYFPDTVLVLDYVSGIHENNNMDEKNFHVFQNFPNPIEEKTTVVLFLPDKDNVCVTVNDIVGRELVKKEFKLDYVGKHYFSFIPGKESIYFLTVRKDNVTRTIKMLKSPFSKSVSAVCNLDYIGKQPEPTESKSTGNINVFKYSLGDQLQYTSTTDLGESTLTDTPVENKTYTFLYGSGDQSCPGMPTVTDVDGNVYNTVLIGDQCWMAENLKTTTYRNGTSIPHVTDAEAWSNLTSGAYAWYNNDISWKDKYGALYNWYTTEDPAGLCPTGWHVPSNDDWIHLTWYIGGTVSPHGNELKSCRQVNSPLGGNCDITEHPRWDENSFKWGTNDYGFSAFPGGTRHYYGSFYGIGTSGGWWSSTEDSIYEAIGRGLGYGLGGVQIVNALKQLGTNIRCLRD